MDRPDSNINYSWFVILLDTRWWTRYMHVSQELTFDWAVGKFTSCPLTSRRFSIVWILRRKSSSIFFWTFFWCLPLISVKLTAFPLYRHIHWIQIYRFFLFRATREDLWRTRASILKRSVLRYSYRFFKALSIGMMWTLSNVNPTRYHMAWSNQQRVTVWRRQGRHNHQPGLSFRSLRFKLWVGAAGFVDWSIWILSLNTMSAV